MNPTPAMSPPPTMNPTPGLDTLLLLPEGAKSAEIIEPGVRPGLLPDFHGAAIWRGQRLEPRGPLLDAAIALDLAGRDLDLFLAAARLRVRPGGTVIVRVPNPAYWAAFAAWLVLASGSRRAGRWPGPGQVRSALACAGFDRFRTFFWFQTQRYPCVIVPPGLTSMRRCLAWLFRQGAGPKQDLVRLAATFAPASLIASHRLVLARRPEVVD